MKKLIVFLMAMLITLVIVSKAPAPLVGSMYGIVTSQWGRPVANVRVKQIEHTGDLGISGSDGKYDVIIWENDNATITWYKNYYISVTQTGWVIVQRGIYQNDIRITYSGSVPRITEPDYNEWRPTLSPFEITWSTAASSLGVRRVALELRGPFGCSDDAHLEWITQDTANDGSFMFTPQNEYVNGCYIRIYAEDVVSNDDMGDAFYITHWGR